MYFQQPFNKYFFLLNFNIINNPLIHINYFSISDINIIECKNINKFWHLLIDMSSRRSVSESRTSERSPVTSSRHIHILQTTGLLLEKVDVVNIHLLLIYLFRNILSLLPAELILDIILREMRMQITSLVEVEVQ